MIKKEIMSKLTATILFFLIFISCKKEEKYYLENQEGNRIEILKENNKLSIFEYDKSKKYLLRSLVKIDDEYFDNFNLNQRLNNKDTFLFLSKNKYIYVLKDKKSLLNDSMKIGFRNQGMYYTEVKSIEKPVNFKYYYDDNYDIKKIIINIGGKTKIFE
jgi:hypothetical protein